MAKLKSNGYDVAVRQWHEHQSRIVVCLHGFTSSSATWEHVAQQLPDYRIIAIDLIGHGETSAPVDAFNYRMEAQVALLHDVLKQLNVQQFTLLGYSMGGRVALSYALAYPQQVEALLLESASPGLAHEYERTARKQADDALAARIEQYGIEAFVNEWERVPLFHTQLTLSADAQQAIRNERLSQREVGLANSLRGIGTGVQPSNWHRLDELTMPVILLTGELDDKFGLLAEKMQAFLTESAHIVVPNVGHAIHVENLTQFATIVKEALQLTETKNLII
ncbi:MAG: 2-succinyl-6-hydroxy-2,4-cyclohexadiene-1-carboxylate synthase [Caryophanon sp.]|nr:2-succinyl-6-hydroxy-2,4-cyclohexadiene-1-carboxylate synthase [Caryophanon sp.]